MDIPLLQLLVTIKTVRADGAQSGLLRLKKHFPPAFRKATGCASPAGFCTAGQDCPCRATFDQALTPDPSALRRYQKPPLPFAFQIPMEMLRPGRQGDGEISLLLVGDATRLVGTYVTALRELFDGAGPEELRTFRLGDMAAVSVDGTRTMLPWQDGPDRFPPLPLQSFAEAVALYTANYSSLSLEILTPLRLVQDGRPLRDLPFPPLAGALFRRISSLAYYYGSVELPNDFKSLADESRRVTCRECCLSWVSLGSGAQGLVGTVSYEGELGDIFPFLLLGSRLNIGKGASYGFGCYRLKPS